MFPRLAGSSPPGNLSALAASTSLLVLAAVAAAWTSGRSGFAIYALSFWHYPLYWWAYRLGHVSPARFRSDATTMKGLALAAYVVACATARVSWPVVALMGSGFALNAAAAWVLGQERTYYGWELGAVPPRQVTSFPYSVVSHPMLLGNVIGFGGALAEPAFRTAWWPLAGLHVLANAGLLLMETRLPSSRHSAPATHPRAASPGRAASAALAAAAAAMAFAVLPSLRRDAWWWGATFAAAAVHLWVLAPPYLRAPLGSYRGLVPPSPSRRCAS